MLHTDPPSHLVKHGTAPPAALPVTRAVTTTGDLSTPSAGPASHLLERSRPGAPCAHTLLLNRPSAMHALTTSMCCALHARLSRLEAERVPAVLLTSTRGKKRAFCAGGDVRASYNSAKTETYQRADEFSFTQFRLDAFMRRMSTPVVAVMDGVTMGGGAGLAAHSRFRIATENTLFAMPECSIGLVPDVGASYFLSRLAFPGLGMYLALTGSRLSGSQVKSVGFATHFVRALDVDALVRHVESSDVHDCATLAAVLKEFDVKEEPWEPIPGLDVIRECFTTDSVETIVSKLEDVAQSGSEKAAVFASTSLKLIRKGCPTSVKVAFEAQTRGASMSLDDCLRMEYRLVARCIRREDFFSGLKSTLITKDRNPVWEPDQLSSVSAEVVFSFFEPLENDLRIPELVLCHDGEGNTGNVVLRSRL